MTDRKLSFQERRPAVCQIMVIFSLTDANLEEFGRTSTNVDRYSAAREHQGHLGILQMHVQRALYGEGMTDETGLCACLSFKEITSVATIGDILLFSDMTDLGGFHADFDHMMQTLHRVANENGFVLDAHWTYIHPDYREDQEFMELLNV